MNLKPIILSFALIALGVSSASAADILHAINFCATNAENIATGVRADHDNFVNEINIIGDLIGYDVKMYDYPGDDCSKENLQCVLSQLQSNPEDIIVFYYSGHGGRNPNDKSKFPQMCLKYSGYQQNNFVPVHYVQDKLGNKPGRLKLILTDCCNVANNLISAKGTIAGIKSATEVGGNESKYYKELFLTNKGMITMTGSEVDKPSYGPDDGGCFSNAFWDVLFSVGRGQVVPDWENVTSMTRQLTMRNTDNDQVPIFDLQYLVADGSANTGSGSTVAVQPSVNPINATNSHFSNSLQQLLSISNVDRRLDTLPGLLRLCSPNAIVQVVGRNLSTVVQTSHISSYMEGVCLSRYIKNINIIEERKNSNGEVTYLKVHEIRNR